MTDEIDGVQNLLRSAKNVLKTIDGKYVTGNWSAEVAKLCAKDLQKEPEMKLYQKTVGKKEDEHHVAFCFKYKMGDYYPKVEDNSSELLLHRKDFKSVLNDDNYWFKFVKCGCSQHWLLQPVTEATRYVSITTEDSTVVLSSTDKIRVALDPTLFSDNQTS